MPLTCAAGTMYRGESPAGRLHDVDTERLKGDAVTQCLVRLDSLSFTSEKLDGKIKAGFKVEVR